MVRTRRPSFFWFLGAALTAASVGAHVRLVYPSTGASLYWSNPDNISIVIQGDGSDDLNDGSETCAIRNAIAAWNGVSESTMRLVEDASANARARTDWASTEVHLVLFDEANHSGFFPGASGIVAITPVTFFTNGQIIDSDVLFNGKNFAFTTSGEPGRFDIQDVATHELGHLIGLDHSGCAGATMYPYVDSSVILHRSLSLDDIRGARHMYPSGSFGQIMGSVTRASSGSLVKGAHIVALDADGRLAGATLTSEQGGYTLRALSAGNYTVYADPLDFPVASENLGGGQTIQTDFQYTVLGTIAVTNGATASLGTQSVDGDVALSIGRVADDYPQRVILGQTTSHTVRGDGLVIGSTLTPSDPAINVTPTAWLGSAVQFNVDVPPGMALGHIDLVVTNVSGERDVLTAGLEITPPNPTVLNVTPSAGDPSGGTFVTLSGTNFRTGARVVLGDRIYVDGESNGCTVVDAGTITLTTRPTIGGTHDTVVIDGSGIEGRRTAAFTITTPPSIATTFPTVGASSGGTEIILTGANFVAGAVVSIDSVVQSNVTVNSPTQVTIVTSAGIVGGPYIVEVMNPGGLTASTAFSYVATPDPRITFVTPDGGPAGGGTSVTVLGSGFTAASQVIFGANPKTGNGGMSATSLQLVDSTRLVVMSPSGAPATAALLVRNTETGQAAVMANAFEYEQPPIDGGSGGFGGCGSIAPHDLTPSSFNVILQGMAWIALAFALAAAQRRQGLRRAAALVYA